MWCRSALSGWSARKVHTGNVHFALQKAFPLTFFLDFQTVNGWCHGWDSDANADITLVFIRKQFFTS